MLRTETTARADARIHASTEDVPSSLSQIIHPLRPMRGPEPLDLGLVIFRGLARKLVPLAIALLLPIQSVDLFLRLRSDRSTGPSSIATSGFPVALLGSGLPHEPFVVMAQSVALSALGIATGMILRGLLEGHVIATRRLLGATVRRIWVALVIGVLTLVVYVITSCMPVIGIVAAGSLTFTASIVAGSEDVGPWRAMRRSWALATASLGFAMGLFIGGVVIQWIVRITLLLGPLLLAAMLSLPDGAWSLLFSLVGVTSMVLQPLTATMAAAAYLALRIRSEGLDLRERIDTVGVVA